MIESATAIVNLDGELTDVERRKDKRVVIESARFYGDRRSFPSLSSRTGRDTQYTN